MLLPIKVFVFLVSAIAPAVESVSPVFGVLSHKEKGGQRTVLVSSYVKWLESAGARVVPLRFGAPQCELDYLMDRVAGLVLPGGSDTTNPEIGFGKFAYNLFKRAEARRIPVWGTCLGHEQIMRFVCYDAAESNPVGSFPSEGHALPLAFARTANASSVFRSLPDDMRRKLETTNLTVNLHVHGIGSSTFLGSRALAHTFDLVATSNDTTGVEFVAWAQHRSLPIVTTQFHIEKNAYEFEENTFDGDDDSGAATPHGQEGVRVGHQLAMWLVEEARKQPFIWKAAELHRYIVWNWPVEFSHMTKQTEWEQQYVFPLQNASSPCPSDVSERIYL
eukprot:TRINITY_DN51300_c0_g1_i1.p1 TRINITY_DN51300_c0_g1~~TRINITY_DN51300_c0_g1_i1.p1  ORF type:complete len:333 (-),score=39.76 TRINITY_DN51300_c0_g1_i1:8-1006(-)